MSLFAQHPLRHALNDEVHARPPVPLSTPEYVSYLAFLHDDGSAQHEIEHLAALLEQVGLAEHARLAEHASDSGHLFVDAGSFRLKWERHNEFSSYTFFRHIEAGDADEDNALLKLPAAWRKDIPGLLITATHIEVRGTADVPPDSVLKQASPHGDTMVAAGVAEGAAWVITDFHIHDGFSRYLLLDDGLTPRQAGRMVQRLVEIETYRVMALLAFPVAKEVGRLLSRAEDELADLMDGLGQARSSDDDRAVLGRLTRLAAEVERSLARTTFRFGAAAAYYRLVQQRIDDMREAASISIVSELTAAGMKVRAFDPVAAENAHEIFKDNPLVEIVDSQYDACEGAQGLLVVTEWNQFRNPDFDKIKSLLTAPLLFDGRNLYSPNVMAQRGFAYFCIGRRAD